MTTPCPECGDGLGAVGVDWCRSHMDRQRGEHVVATPEFKPFPKVPRFHRDVVITEKIDGTNACVIVDQAGDVHAQSRTRLITPGKQTDNYGFAAWVSEHADELRNLGFGYHYGEWYGQGIQRNYGLEERRFALFNPDTENVPDCCEVVPVLEVGNARSLNQHVGLALLGLRLTGSAAVEGFRQPEGISIYHTAARCSFKVLLEGDDIPKGAR